VRQAARIYDLNRGTLVTEARVAATFWRRLVGMMLDRSPSSALLLVPCRSVHTFRMRFPIDIAFLDAHGAVVEVRHGVPPGRIVRPAAAGAHAILEAPAGGLSALRAGDLLKIVV
jgi:uncharacterized protein